MAGYVEVAKADNAIFIRVVGLGNFNNAGPLREYAENAFAVGARSAVVDLAKCTGLDSTFMGTLVLMKDYPVDNSPNKTPIAVTIVNATATTLRAMTSLGLPALLHVKEEPVEFPAVTLERLREGWQDQRRRTRLIHDAHLQLIRGDKANEARFGPFLAALVKEARLHGEQQP
ncbi:MAG: STAS domain-containing protein [Planctomycetes bacterium]|nr:STAS domain-containing protein [Planctomycetota bacterium]